MSKKKEVVDREELGKTIIGNVNPVSSPTKKEVTPLLERIRELRIQFDTESYSYMNLGLVEADLLECLKERNKEVHLARQCIHFKKVICGNFNCNNVSCMIHPHYDFDKRFF